MRFFLLLTLLFLTSCQILNRIREEKNIIKIDNQDSDHVFDAVIREPIQEQNRSVIYDTISSMPNLRRVQREEGNSSNNTIHLLRQESVVVEKQQHRRNTTTTGGQIIYSVPDTMQVAKNYQVVVRISSCQKNIEIEENISGRVVRKSIKTSSRMQVELVDPGEDVFTIKPITTQKQIIDSSYTEWRWSVTPKKSGDYSLDLVVSIIIGDDVKQTVLSDRIWIKTNTRATVKKFWYENWKWSFEKILIPLVAWIGGILIGRKLKDKK